MTIKIKALSMVGEEFSARLIIGGVPGPLLTIEQYGDAPEVVEMQAFGGRVNVLDAAIASVTQGSAVARSDGKTTLDLRDLTTSASIPAILSNGQQSLIAATAPALPRGHPSGEHYVLPKDGNNRYVCAPGQRHRKIYFSEAPAALTRAQIAADAGVTEATVTGAWLLTRPQYGGTEATKVHTAVANLIRAHVTANGMPSRSDHWIMERGHDYLGFALTTLMGEDELHPVLVTSFGTGAKPKVRMTSSFLSAPYVVLQDVDTDEEKVSIRYGYCTAFDHVDVGKEIVMADNVAITVHECDFLKAFWLTVNTIATTGTGIQVWNPQGANYISGMYASESEGILVDSCLLDHAGWADGHSFDLLISSPQPPTKFSHNIYFAANVYDVTIRYCLNTRASSCGTQLRAGAHLEGNIFAENGILSNCQSQEAKQQYVNCLDNIGFGGGYKFVKSYPDPGLGGTEGEQAGGFHWTSAQTGALGNILAHNANPDDPAEIAARTYIEQAQVKVGLAPIANDTIVYRRNIPNVNIEGLDTSVLDATTLQKMGGMLMGQPSATVQELVDYMAAQDNKGPKVAQGRRWVQSRFGRIAGAARSTPADLVFRPEVAFEGFRWDNRYNWSTKDLPGTHVADTADLDGHFLRYGTLTAEIAALHSKGGTLDVTSGRLNIGALTDAADMLVRMSGQVWIGDAEHPLSVEATGGALALTGEMSNLDLYAGGQSLVLLGPDCTAESIIISGQRARVGWDGSGTAALTIGRLEFRRGVRITAGGLNDAYQARINSLTYKHIGKTVTGSVSGFTARVAGVERNDDRGGKISIWLSDVEGIPQVGETFAVSPRRNTDGTDTPVLVQINSVGAFGISPLQRFRSGLIGTGLAEPTVSPTANINEIVLPSGLTPGQPYDLTGAGVVLGDLGDLPPGVVATGGKLVYTP
ncbi:hypothetical protein PARHAE_00771 [Paracoccus haematequi]|uniref:Uncharacterized protein n=1 Tax=Paracoccus haematequi TaxID=2491866 RepID=A0A447IJG3_9RHOB|nr:hypothetical protein [Paracoccus haematequi]VDS07594.1 hypothetical protein PARHAE_00771 [Paracoccus haematequi]